MRFEPTNRGVKSRGESLLLLLALITALYLIAAGPLRAQTFTTLYNFTGLTTNSAGVYTNIDGSVPSAGLALAGNTVYGTTWFGGDSGWGTVYAVNIDGTGFAALHNFTRGAGDYPFMTNPDGAGPRTALIVSGDTLYGTAPLGGSFALGTVFKLKTNGTGFNTLHNFTPVPASEPYTNSDGAAPAAGLTLSGNTLYGTTQIGGAWGNGTVFAINTDGTGFTNLHSFEAVTPFPGPYTNSEGAQPYARVTLSGRTLYGTTSQGGTWEGGTVFAVNTDGSGFTNLHSFNVLSDGARPVAGLVLSGNTLYGTTYDGGTSARGTVFAVNTDGTGFTNLHFFTSYGLVSLSNTNGANPSCELVLSGNTLYGTTEYGGPSGYGTIFTINTDGTGFTNLHTLGTPVGPYFNRSGGAEPHGGLVLFGNTLYGTTASGGAAGAGEVFSFSLPPPKLALVHFGPNIVVTWPANTWSTLQSATSLGSPAGWTTLPTGPLAANGQNAVTNPASSTKKFYRLIP
jgi:uncharacterized repeat protein (TIGR03803 family)